MPLPYQQHRPGTAQTPFYPPPPRPNTSATANNDSHLHYRPTSARQPFEIPTFPPRPPSSALHHGSSAVPRHMPTTGAIGLDESIRLPPSRQPDTAATMLTAHAAQASKQPALPFGQGYEESANPMLGPTQHSAMPSQLFSFPSSARQPTSAAHSDREDDQSQAQPYRNGLLVPETHAPGGIRGVKAQGHWSPAKPNGKKEDAGDVGEEGGSRTASEGSRLGEGRNADESGIHAPRPSRAIDVRGMDYAAGRKESFPLGTPPLESQYATQSQHPQQTNKIGAAEGGRTADKGDSDGAVETQLCSLSQMNRGQQHGQYSESQGRPMKRTRSFGEHQQSNQHDSSQSQSQYQPSKHARVDSYYPSAAGPSFRQPLPPALSRGQAYTPTPVLASNHARTPDMTRAASSRPFAIPASRQNVAPLPSTPAWRPQNSTLGQKVRNPAELFMAVAQQGAEGKAKTTSERILSRIDEVFVQLMEQLSSTVTMQQQGRDQLHDLRLGQRALATREEIVEDIAGQLTPALQECFQTLTTNIAQMLEPVARDTADLVVDEIKNAMIEQKKGEAVEKAKDNEAQKPLSELVTHLVKKLDTVGNIATFLDSCKDLPDVLRDVAVYKQSLDAVTAMVQKHAQGIQGVQGAMSVQAMYEELKGALQGIGAKLGAGNGALVGAGAGAGGLGEILASVRALDQRISTVMPTLPSVLSPLRAPQLSPSSETTLLSRKVDHLNSQLASLKDMLVQQHANPPQLDIPSIVQQLRQAIMAPSVEDSHIGEVTRATSPANQMQVVQTQQNDLPSAFDYSQILQSTQMGSTQLPDHLVTPVTSMRHGTLPAHGQGQTDMYGHNQHLQNGFTFSPYDWQNQGHGDLAMTLGMGAGEGSQYTDMPLPIDGGGSGFIHVPQGMLRSTEGLGGLGMQRSGRYNSDQRQGEGEAPEQDQQEGITLMRTASDHPINDFRLGQAGLQGDDRFNLSGPELGLSVLAGEADVFGQIQNIGSTPAVGSSTSAFVSHARARHDQQSQPPAFRPYYPTLPAEMGGGANPPSSPAHTIAEHSAMLGEDEEESFVDEYADIFDNPGPKPNVTPIGGRKTSGNSTGTGTGKGKGKRRAAPSPVPAPTPMRTPANKKGRGSPAKTASPALTPGMQPVSKRTRKGSALVPSALEQAAKASARPGMPGTPGTASARSPTRNISDDAVDRFGVPRRLSDRIARRSSAAVTDSPASALSGRGTRAGDSADDAIRLSSDSSGPSGLSGSSKANSRNSKQVKQELLDGLMQQGQGDNGKTGGSGEAAGELGLAVHVEEQEEDGDESSMDAQTAQSTREWARIQEEQRLIMGTGKKAVTYGGRKKRVVNALDSEESE